MSIKVMSWVMDEAPVENTTEMVVLYVLADHARNDGTCAWPSHSTIADKTRCSRRTVLRHIKALEERGLIVRGDQRHVAHVSADKRPVVWDLNMNMKRQQVDVAGCQNVTPKPSGVTTMVERGDNGGRGGVTTSAQRRDTGVTQPILNPSLNPSLNQCSSVDEPKHHDHFTTFWDSYPRKKGDKKKVADQFATLAEEVGADSLILAAQNFAAECKEKETAPRYICYPSTFLTQKRWMDYQQSAPDTKPTIEEATGWTIDWNRDGSHAGV